eukprot:4492525-Amphidinium_carterae.1
MLGTLCLRLFPWVLNHQALWSSTATATTDELRGPPHAQAPAKELCVVKDYQSGCGHLDTLELHKAEGRVWHHVDL